MNLKKRLDILNETGTICNKTKEVMLSTIKLFDEKFNIILTEENGAMAITHLSMAIMRVRKNEPVKEINNDVYIEILESEHLNKAYEIYEELSNVIDIKLPEEEKKYMLVNICVILENYEG